MLCYLKFSVGKPECPFGVICGVHVTRDVRSAPEGNDEGSRANVMRPFPVKASQ